MIVIDRVEGDRVILEIAGELVEVDARVLPPGARDGDILRLERSEDHTALNEAKARLERLRTRDPLEDEITL